MDFLWNERGPAWPLWPKEQRAGAFFPCHQAIPEDLLDLEQPAGTTLGLSVAVCKVVD